MQVFKVDLYKEFNYEKKDGQIAELTCWLHGDAPEIKPDRRRPAMLVLAGGGYVSVSDREREPIAVKYFEQGFNVFDLKYSIAPNFYPTQLIEACMAMAYIRTHAEEFHVLGDKVAAIGFSAGGHLLGTLATLYGESEVKKVVGNVNVRPDACVFSYAVITSGYLSHAGSINVVSGGDETLKEKLSVEKLIDKNSPPAFIWCTANDNAVPCENSIELALAYRKAGAPFELHVFENGVHGLSVCSEESRSRYTPDYINEPVSKWLPLSFTWLKNKGFLIK